MNNRVVITGMGVVAPNALGLEDFESALRSGRVGIRQLPELEEYGITCKWGGKPPLSDETITRFCSDFNLVKLRSSGILYGCMAGVEAWRDAGLSISERKTAENADWKSGCIFGTSCAGIDAFQQILQYTRTERYTKMGGRMAQQGMNSGISAYLGGILGLGNQVTTFSSEGNTGVDSVVAAYRRIHWGLADRMLAGSTESSSIHIYAAYDSIIADNGKYASVQSIPAGKDSFPMRPLSQYADGFVPAAGSGALVLESLQSARKRGARIYGEIIGVHANSGGQRNGGKLMTMNKMGLINCISGSLQNAGICAGDVDLISGNFQSNYCDEDEAACISQVWDGKGKGGASPFINAPKALLGHCLSGAGSLELVASTLQLYGQFIHPTPHSRPLHPFIKSVFSPEKIPLKAIRKEIKHVLKISYGVGDNNACVVLGKLQDH